MIERVHLHVRACDLSAESHRGGQVVQTEMILWPARAKGRVRTTRDGKRKRSEDALLSLDRRRAASLPQEQRCEEAKELNALSQGRLEVFLHSAWPRGTCL